MSFDQVITIAIGIEAIRACVYFLLPVIALILIVEFFKRFSNREHRSIGVKFHRLLVVSSMAKPSHYLVGFLIAVCACTVKIAHEKILDIQAENRQLEAAISEAQSKRDVQETAPSETEILELLQTIETLTDRLAEERFGSPPTPKRLGHPKRISGVYYRGNDERHPQLFNGGNYRTASFRVELCDADRKSIRYGDAVPLRGLFIRFEIERAANTAAALFSEDIMSSVFLASKYPLQPDESDHHVALEPLENDRRWVAYFPIAMPETREMSKLSGLVYVYEGRVIEGIDTRTLHYGIRYDLFFDDDRITAESDLWMGTLLWTLDIDKLPAQEWFDDRPIPQITGPNTEAPNLLGVERHSRQKRAANR